LIAIDTNLLVYGARGEFPEHRAALDCIRSLAEGNRSWTVPWPCLHEFIGVVTNPRIFKTPTLMSVAFDAIDRMVESPRFLMLGEGADHLETLRGLCEASAISGPMIHDARIAAICLDHGVRELWSCDRDFSRFPALKVVNPLVRR
jgi:uncharacterized protein